MAMPVTANSGCVFVADAAIPDRAAGTLRALTR